MARGLDLDIVGIHVWAKTVSLIDNEFDQAGSVYDEQKGARTDDCGTLNYPILFIWVLLLMPPTTYSRFSD